MAKQKGKNPSAMLLLARHIVLEKKSQGYGIEKRMEEIVVLRYLNVYNNK